VVDRFRAQLAVLRDKLGTADYFGGAAPNALDAYVATFLTIVTPFDTAACPNIVPALHAAFASGAVELGPLVPGTLVALRTRMFEQHLAFPIEL
jgi:glutathione S-transferase